MATELQQLAVPSYLALPPELAALNAAAKEIGGQNSPHLSIKQSRWRRVDAEGNETILPDFAIQMIVVAANPNVSRVFYLKAYDPAGEAVAPDCASDNGIRPNPGMAHPQAETCAVCPNAVWGSAVNPQTGKALKACKDSKRLAVILPGDATETVYAWRVPVKTMQELSRFIHNLNLRGVQLSQVVVKAEMDTTVDYPCVKFSAARWVSAEELPLLLRAASSPEAVEAVGLRPSIGGDTPVVVTPVKREPELAPMPAHLKPQGVKATPTPEQSLFGTQEADLAPAKKPRGRPPTVSAAALPQTDAALDQAIEDALKL